MNEAKRPPTGQPAAVDTMQILVCLREAVADALEQKRRLGQYAVLWQDGRLVEVGEDAPGRVCNVSSAADSMTPQPPKGSVQPAIVDTLESVPSGPSGIDMAEGDMDVKAAVVVAKQYINELFAEEGIKNLGLEEVEFDENEQAWQVTIGFLRPWDAPPSPLATLAGQNPHGRRAYKVIRIANADGRVLSVRGRLEQV